MLRSVRERGGGDAPQGRGGSVRLGRRRSPRRACSRRRARLYTRSKTLASRSTARDSARDVLASMGQVVKAMRRSSQRSRSEFTRLLPWRNKRVAGPTFGSLQRERDESVLLTPEPQRGFQEQFAMEVNFLLKRFPKGTQKELAFPPRTQGVPTLESTDLHLASMCGVGGVVHNDLK